MGNSLGLSDQLRKRWWVIALVGIIWIVWLVTLINGSPITGFSNYKIISDYWIVFFTSVGLLVNAITLIVLYGTFKNQRTNHEESMVESAFFSMLNSYNNLASSAFAAQEIPVYARDLRYLNRLAHDTAFNNVNTPGKWDKKENLSLRSGRSFFVDFYRFLRGSGFIYKRVLKKGISHEDLFRILYENPSNKNAFWPVCETIFLNFLAILVYLRSHNPVKEDLYKSILYANVSMEEMILIYYLGHAKFQNGMSPIQKEVLKKFFEEYPLERRVPEGNLLQKSPLQWGTYTPEEAH